MNGSNGSYPWKEWGGRMQLLYQTPKGIALISVLSVLGMLIILANALVFMLMVTRSRLRTPTNFFLVSLAASDLLLGSLVIPLVLSCSCTGFQPGICLSMDLCQRFLSISTILHLLVATLERHLKIHKPFTYPRLVTKRRAVTVVVFIWVLSLATSFIQLFWVNVNADEQERIRISKIEVTYTALCLTVLVLIPFLVMVFAYIHIFFTIKRELRRRTLLTHRRRSKESEEERKRKENERRVAVVYLAMFITFVLGWFPYFLFSLFIDLLSIQFMVPFWVNFILVLFKFGTAFINPVLYTFFKSDFQKALKSLAINCGRNTSKGEYKQSPSVTAVSQLL